MNDCISLPLEMFSPKEMTFTNRSSPDADEKLSDHNTCPDPPGTMGATVVVVVVCPVVGAVVVVIAVEVVTAVVVVGRVVVVGIAVVVVGRVVVVGTAVVVTAVVVVEGTVVPGSLTVNRPALWFQCCSTFDPGWYSPTLME